MKLTGISMVRNDADVIEAFVRHHAGLVDELLVVDHSSTDGTGGLLGALVDEGLPLLVRRESSLVQRQNVVLTSLMRDAAGRRRADWVLPLDADEFLVAVDGDLREVIAELPPDRPCSLELRYYVPCADDPEGEMDVLQRIRHRVARESTVWTRKLIVPARAARSRRRALAQGSHELLDVRTGEPVATSSTERLALAHFPVRSAAQLARKALGGWPAHLARPDRPPDQKQAFQWERAFNEAVAGRLTPARLHVLALDYPVEEPNGQRRPELVLDPVPSDLTLRYDVPEAPRPLEVLAETTVRLAEELGGALRGKSPR